MLTDSNRHTINTHALPARRPRAHTPGRATRQPEQVRHGPFRGDVARLTRADEHVLI